MALHHQFFRHTVAADQLDHDIHFGIGDDGKRIVGHATCATGDLLRQLDVAIGHHGDADGATGTARDLFRVTLQDGVCTATDCADTE